MAAATIWKGHIHFGTIDVPVKMHAAVRDERVRFHLLHKRDHTRLQQQMFCTHENRAVASDEQAKGYELEKGKYLLLDPKELEQIVPEASRVIEVHEFVNTAEIDPLFLDRAYYLEPDDDGVSYQALASALQKLDAAGICTWTMRKRSYVGAVQARGRVLRLNTLRSADEVIPVASLGLPEATMTEKELNIGTQLIGQMTASFEPRKFENEHQKKLQAMIDQKMRGETVAVLPSRQLQPTEPNRLLEALEASLKKAA